MRDKVRYTDEPMEVGRIVKDFLPPPDKLIFKEDAIKVTITLSARTVYFFKTEAEKRGLQYQRMIRRLLDAYVEAFESRDKGAARRGAKQVRAEQARAPYRKTSRRARAR